MLAVMVVMIGITAAEEDPWKIYGTITDANNNPLAGQIVEIQKDNGGQWHSLGLQTTDALGNYDTGYKYFILWGWGLPNDNYRMYLNGNLVATSTIQLSDWVWDEPKWKLRFSYQWNSQIPEFPTVALPIVAVLGLVFFFQKTKKE